MHKILVRKQLFYTFCHISSCCKFSLPIWTKKKRFYEITQLYMGNMWKVCRMAFAVYKLHNLTKILLIAHIAQLNFSRSNFYSDGEIWNSSIYCLGYKNIGYMYIVPSVCYIWMLGPILTDYSFKPIYVFF